MHDVVPQLPPIRIDATSVSGSNYILELVIGAHRFSLAKHTFKTIDEAKTFLSGIMKDKYIKEVLNLYPITDFMGDHSHV